VTSETDSLTIWEGSREIEIKGTARRDESPRAGGGPSDLQPTGTFAFRNVYPRRTDSADALDSVERVLWWLFGSSAGASTRTRLMLAIREKPRNALQLAEALDVDYTTVRHHLRVLAKNGLVTTVGERYGQVYFPSSSMESHWSVFERIAQNVTNEGERNASK